MIIGQTRYEGLTYALSLRVTNCLWTHSYYSAAEFMYQGSNPNAEKSGQEIRLTIQSPLDAKKKIVLTRITDSNGYCIFPLGDVVDSMLDQPRASGRRYKPFEMNYATNFTVSVHDPLSDVDGIDASFIGQAIRGYNEDYFSRRAFLPKTIIYPAAINGRLEYPLFYPYSSEASETGQIVLQEKDNRLWSKENIYFDGMFLWLYGSMFDDIAWNANIIRLNYVDKLNVNHGHIVQNIEVDKCEEGVFLRWIDKYGIFRYYRWTEETVEDEQETTSEYIQLGEYLTPYHKSTKSVKHTYRLHSRFVDSDTLALCRSIVGAQWITILSASSEDDKHVTLTNVDNSQTGDVLNDMVIEVTETEYLQ